MTRRLAPQQLLQLFKRKQVQFVDLRFTDPLGAIRHLSVPAGGWTVDSFTSGYILDGPPAAAWPASGESGLRIVPAPSTFHIDPFSSLPTAAMMCDVKDALSRRDNPHDPRSIARTAQARLKRSGIADTARFGVTLEFFIFDNVWYDQSTHFAKYQVDSREGAWNRGNEDPNNLGNQIRPLDGSLAAPPVDALYNLRAQIARTLLDCGITIRAHRRALATAGQAAIDLPPAPLLDMADQISLARYVIKNVAARHGKVATFMPMPLFGDHGSAMCTQFSLGRRNRSMFADAASANLSQTALYAIGGILAHTPSLCAICNPTTNSYRRLLFAGMTPARPAWSPGDRAACLRALAAPAHPDGAVIELRFPDPSCNPYLAFSAIAMAALDGVRNKIDPPPPLENHRDEPEPHCAAGPDAIPPRLEDALDALHRDHAFLLEDDVFTTDVIQYWIDHKRRNECESLHRRPHPWEFCMYFDT